MSLIGLQFMFYTTGIQCQQLAVYPITGHPYDYWYFKPIGIGYVPKVKNPVAV